MPTFIVGITENITTRYSVEAPDLQAAEGIAMALFRCGSSEGYLGVAVREEATAWPEEVPAEPEKLECVECGLPTQTDDYGLCNKCHDAQEEASK